jgi:hypothetical protein
MKRVLSALALVVMSGGGLAEDRSPRSSFSSPQKPPYAAYSGYAKFLGETAADKFFHGLALTDAQPLVDLDIYDSVISDRGAESLAKCRFPMMHISNCRVSQTGFGSILGSKHLRSLVAYKVPLDKVDFASLSATDSQVAYLEIITSQLDDESLMTLAPNQSTFQLQLQNSRLRGPGLAVLKKIPKLLRLEIGRNPIDDEGLANLPPLPELRYLSLDATKITDAGLSRLSPMPELKQLNLSNNAISGAGLRAFSESKKLTEINLKDTRVDDDSIPMLPTSPVLKELDLRRTKISDLGLNRLALPDSLEHLFLEGDNLTSDAILNLSRKYPHVYVHSNNPGSKSVRFHAGVRKEF